MWAFLIPCDRENDWVTFFRSLCKKNCNFLITCESHKLWNPIPLPPRYTVNREIPARVAHHTICRIFETKRLCHDTQLLFLSSTKATSQLGFATLAIRGCTLMQRERVQSSWNQRRDRKYSQRFALQGASRDIFLTNNLEPRPGRVEVTSQYSRRVASEKRRKLLTPLVFSKCVIKFEP